MTRSSGILLPVSALPGPCGIGDLGTAAREFIDFLLADPAAQSAGQRALAVSVGVDLCRQHRSAVAGAVHGARRARGR